MQTAVTYVGLVGTLTDLGFSALYVREGARHTDQLSRYWNNVASLKVIGAVVGLPLIFAALYFAGVRSLLWPSFAILVLSGYQLLLRNTLVCDAAADVRDHRDRSRDARGVCAGGHRRPHQRRHRVLPLGVCDQLRLRVRLFRDGARRHGRAAAGAAAGARAALLVGEGRRSARHHLHHHDRLFQGGRARSCSGSGRTARSGTTPSRTSRSNRCSSSPSPCAAWCSRCSPCTTGSHPSGCCRWPRSSSRRW